MKNWQDFLEITDEAGLKQFIVSAVEEWQCGEVYKTAKEALLYAEQENTAINSREFKIPVKYKTADGRIGETFKPAQFRANNRIANGMFNKLVTQKVEYLLGDGLSIDKEQKKLLGKGIDNKVKKAGMLASLTSVAWAYGFLNDGAFDIEIFSGEEVVPIIDEDSGEVRAAIRFYNCGKTAHYELFTTEGISRFKKDKSGGLVAVENKNYINKKLAFKGSEITLESKGIGKIPLVPFYNADNRKSDFRQGLKRQLDLYDIILSDFGNNLEDNRDIYWVLQNYRGQDIQEFYDELETYKVIKTGDAGNAMPHTLEVPFEARKIALEILRKQIISDYMGLDMDAIRGGSLTNVAIMAAYADLDLKVSQFEWQALEFANGIIDLMRLFTGSSEEIQVDDFRRRTLMNDGEIVADLMNSPQLSQKTRIERNPYAAEDEWERVKEEEAQYGLSIEEFDDERHTQPNGQAIA